MQAVPQLLGLLAADSKHWTGKVEDGGEEEGVRQRGDAISFLPVTWGIAREEMVSVTQQSPALRDP